MHAARTRRERAGTAEPYPTGTLGTLMAKLPLRRATSALVALTTGAILGACSEQSSPLAPTAPAPAAATASTPNALLGINLGGLLGGLLNLVGGVVRGVVGGLPLPKPLPSAAFNLLARDHAHMQGAVSHGLASVPALTCVGQAPAAVTQRIGPSGGVITIGRHQLEIPAGALDSVVSITASVPNGAGAALEFAPHGLQFDKPVRITLDYSSCAIPTGSYLNVVYSDAPAGGVVLDGMPSMDLSSEHKIVALTDHFSGYITAWGRQ